MLVPAKYKAKDDFALGHWILTKRKDRSNGRMTEEEIRQLDALGMAWNAVSAKWERGYAEAAVLNRLKVTEQLNGWEPPMRSKARVRIKPKRYFCDPSLAATRRALR